MEGLSYILLGSNMGKREKLLNDATALIELRCGRVILKSSFYESEPWGFDAEQNFINQAICIESILSAHDLMKELLNIESELGRIRIEGHIGYQSRPIDLDIIYYGNMINEDKDLTLPHPKLHLRRFVLEPLCEIAPDFVHPILRLTNKELLEKCNDENRVSLI